MADETANGNGWAYAARNQSPMWSDDVGIRPDWHARANCGRNGILGDDAAVRVKIMFPERGGNTARALKVCNGCPVKFECRRENDSIDLAHAREVGVWASSSGRMRRLAK